MTIDTLQNDNFKISPIERARIGYEGRRLPLLILLLISSLFMGQVHAEKLRVGTNLWPGYEPLYLAEINGVWSANNNIKLIEFPSATEVLRAFRNRVIEVAALTLDEVLLLIESGFPVTIVLVLDISYGADVIMAPNSWKEFSDIKGKRVGVERSTLGAYVLTRALEINQISLDDVEVVSLHFEQHEKAYINKKVDAVVTFDPVRTHLKNLGAKEIFSSREIPGEIVDVLVIHDDKIEQNKMVLQALVDGWFQTLHTIKSRPKQSATIMGKRLNLTPDEVLESIKYIQYPNPEINRRMIGGKQPELAATVLELSRVMAASKLLTPGGASALTLSDAFLP
jgi:NitT/TauT family transport system substrate-binding protein